MVFNVFNVITATHYCVPKDAACDRNSCAAAAVNMYSCSFKNEILHLSKTERMGKNKHIFGFLIAADDLEAI